MWTKVWTFTIVSVVEGQCLRRGLGGDFKGVSVAGLSRYLYRILVGGLACLETEPKGRPSGVHYCLIGAVDSGIEITGYRTGVKNNALIKDIQSD